ncbi:PIN-like domain-containing protein, partial [Chryseobacterium sp. HMWF035]|uniref:PIN-like domain-containing protein n=1 Tax=Chryseobacterium sp. HMWF035 TaxID=2056868 RepID=UPI000D589224
MITEETNFVSKLNNCDIKTYKECLDRYTKNFDKVLKLETDFPIFLDTNVLLRYYSISFTAREKLFDFINENKKRIIITHQVQKEFLKNREDVIKKFFEKVTKKIPTDFSSNIVNQLKNFIEQHKVILKDYPYVETEIMKHKDELELILDQLNKDSDNKYSEFKNLIWKDKFLDLLYQCNHIDNLNNEETILLKTKFDYLKKDIKPNEIENILNKTRTIFPGLGDIKDKPDDPYG